MRKIWLSLGLVIVLMLAMAIPCFADSPTTTTVNWSGAGVITGVVNTGATTSQFVANISSGSGYFTATDSNDNPYNYGVDTQSAYITGAFSGGSMSFQTDRLTSQSMYGSAGQRDYAYVFSTGTGAMATGSSTNYAEMTNGTYGKTLTSGGHNFEANGDAYQINQRISSLNAIASFNATNIISQNGNQFVTMGNGSAVIDCMTTGAYGANGINLGWGGGCYTNADAVFTGSGNFTTYASGANSITTPIAGANGAMVAGGWSGSGNGTSGSVTLQTIMNFTNGGSVGNYSISVR